MTKAKKPFTIPATNIRRNQKIISGRRAGVQSCDKESANVFVEIGGLAHYARMDRVNKTVEPSMRYREAVDFVIKHFAEYDQLCTALL